MGKEGKAGGRGDRVFIYNAKVGACMVEMVGRARSLEERRSKGREGDQRSMWVLKFPAATNILNFKIVCNSVNPLMPVGKQFKLGCSIKCVCVHFLKS